MNRSNVVKIPKVSVIISTYNRSKYVTEAIVSVLNQTYKDFEIIVVDDGSTDNTKIVLKPYMGKIKYIYKENEGCASARNVGIRNSTGEFVTFLDSDDLFERDKLEIQIKFFEDNPKVDFVYSDCCIFYEGSSAPPQLHHAINLESKDVDIAQLFFPYPNIHIPTILIRRKCLENLGLFSETLFDEDSNFFMRAAIHCQVRYLQKPIAKIRKHIGCRSLDRVEVFKSIIKSSEMLLEKYPTLKKSLGDDATRKVNNLRYRLAFEYAKIGDTINSKKEFKTIIKKDRKQLLKACPFIIILLFGVKISRFCFNKIIPYVRNKILYSKNIMNHKRYEREDGEN